MNEEGIFVFTLIFSVVGLLISYYIIERAVVNALKKRDMNSGDRERIEWLLTNILIQLEGNPNEYSKIEKLSTVEFEEARKKLAKSSYSNKKYKTELLQLQDQFKDSLNNQKMEKFSKI